jgi:paraquat-inducible protein B
VSDAGPQRTQATVRRTRWPGWIWAVPIAAVAIVGWLGIRYVVNRGPEVKVTFESAAGLTPGDTKVKYRGIDVGTVEDVGLAKDLRHVIVTLRLRNDVRSTLREGTQFWIADATPDLADLSSLKAMITGPHIEMEPGPGKPARAFTGSTQAPIVANGANGLRISFHTDEIGAIRRGSTITYLGLRVGTVEGTKLASGGKGFTVSAFIGAPYDKLVHAGSRFWKASSIHVSTGGAGLTADVPSLEALVSGAIAFDTPDGADAGPVAEPENRFELYADKDKAHAAPLGPHVSFLVRFDGPVGDLAEGAPVELKGFRIGEVARVALDFDAATGELRTPVTIDIDAHRLHIAGIAPPGNGDWTPAVTDAVDRLVRVGYRARLDRSTPVVGGRIVTLAKADDAPATLIRGGPEPEIPTAASGDIGDIATKAGNVMAKIDNVPIADIGRDVQRTVQKIAAVTSSPEVEQSLDHVNDALAGLDRTIREAGPQVSPTIASLRRTADAAQNAVTSADAVLGGPGAEQDQNIGEALKELSDAARSIRALADYLDRHPEALVEGRSNARP